MFYLDSTVFLYAVLFQGPKTARAQDLLRSIAAGEISAATASLTVDEVVWKLSQLTDRPTAIDEGGRMLSAGIEIISVTRESMASALALMQEWPSLDPRDAVHVATAKAIGANQIVSDDSDFKRIAAVPHRPL